MKNKLSKECLKYYCELLEKRELKKRKKKKLKLIKEEVNKIKDYEKTSKIEPLFECYGASDEEVINYYTDIYKKIA